MSCVAVIDVGSNSIKVLVAARDSAGAIQARLSRTIEARISSGIGGSRPRLGEEGMARGLAALEELLAEAATFSPAQVAVVATSAVRDAANGGEFRNQVRAATGREIRILTGEEEANAIGRGLTCDPGLADLRDFYVFDLGGGSLECLAFRARLVQQAVSLPLGCVRLAEKFFPDLTLPLDTSTSARIAAHTRAILDKSTFKFNLPAATGVGTGGTVSTVRAIVGARHGQPAEATAPRVTLDQLRELLGELGALPLSRRRQVAGLPPGRADVFPTALVTIIAIAERAGLTEFRHSFHNLRWGIAAGLLESL